MTSDRKTLIVTLSLQRNRFNPWSIAEIIFLSSRTWCMAVDCCRACGQTSYVAVSVFLSIQWHIENDTDSRMMDCCFKVSDTRYFVKAFVLVRSFPLDGQSTIRFISPIAVVLADQACSFSSVELPLFLWSCDVVYIEISYQYRSPLHRDAQCTRTGRYLPYSDHNHLICLLVEHFDNVIDFLIHRGPVN